MFFASLSLSAKDDVLCERMKKMKLDCNTTLLEAQPSVAVPIGLKGNGGTSTPLFSLNLSSAYSNEAADSPTQQAESSANSATQFSDSLVVIGGH